jgi:hypothetical protein
MKIKEAMPLVAAACYVVGCNVLDARADYDWAPAIAAKVAPEGWTPVASRANFVDITRPWTIVKTPTTTLFFVARAKRRVYTQNLIGIPVLFATWDYSKTEQFGYFCAANSQYHKLATIWRDSTPPSDLGSIPDTAWKTPSTGADSALLRVLTVDPPKQ